LYLNLNVRYAKLKIIATKETGKSQVILFLKRAV